MGINIYRMLFNGNYRAFEDMKEDIDECINDEDLKDLLNNYWKIAMKELVGMNILITNFIY